MEDGSNRIFKQPETAIKRRFTALNFSVFLYISGMTDYGDVLTPVFIVFLPFKAIYDAVFFDLGSLHFKPPRYSHILFRHF